MSKRNSTALSILLSLSLACTSNRAIHPRAAEEINRGFTHLRDGDKERAEVAFEHALEFDPELAEALNGRGIVERQRNRFEEARRWYETAIRHVPDFAEAHSNLGETLIALGQHQKGEEELVKALEIDPDLADARLNLARALLHRGRSSPTERSLLWSRSRRQYLHLLESRPDLPEAYQDLGYLEFWSGAHSRAERSYRRALELSPSSIEALHGLCASLACMGLAPDTLPCRQSLKVMLDDSSAIKNEERREGVTLPAVCSSNDSP